MVGRPLSPWTAKIVEVLTPPEGESPEWVDFKLIVDAASPSVPYERAMTNLVSRDFTSIDTAKRDLIAIAVSALGRSKKVEILFVPKPFKHIDKVRLTQKGITNKPALKSNIHPWTTKIVDVLQDGEWHPYEEVMEATSFLVPPGMAWRKAEESRLRHYTKTGQPPGERVRGNRSDTIRSGQRYYINHALKALRKSNRIEVEYGTQEVRKRPTRIRLKP